MTAIRMAAIVAFFATLLQAWADPVPLQGTARATSGTFTGFVSIDNGIMTVGGRALPLDDTLYLALQPPDAVHPPANALCLADGDCWRVELVGLSNQTVVIRSPELGERRVELATVLSLDFLPDETTPDMDMPGTMYRREGPSLPGDLVWIKERDVAVKSLLGVLPLPRQSLVRYVVPARPAARFAALDQLRLTDGSLYHGRLGLEGDRVILQHALGVTIKVPADRIRYFSRHTPRIQWLTSLAGRNEPGVALLGQAAAPQVIIREASGVAVPCMQALRVQPPMRLLYAVPTAGMPRVFEATIAPRPCNVGDVYLQVRAGADALFERTLLPSSKPEAVVLPLPADKDLEIVVAYGDRLAFPASIDLCDPFVRVAE